MQLRAGRGSAAVARRSIRRGTPRTRLPPLVPLSLSLALVALTIRCGAPRSAPDPGDVPPRPAGGEPEQAADDEAVAGGELAVTRDLPREVHLGQAVTVSLAVEAPAAVSAYTIRESPPPGWVVTRISDGGTFDASTGRLVWRLTDGGIGRVTYRIRPSADAPRRAAVSGAVRWGDGARRPVAGDTSVAVVPRDARVPGGREILEEVRNRGAPLGIAALDALADSLETAPLAQVVRAQNRWARRQIEAQRSAPARSDPRLLLEPFVAGPGGLRSVFAGAVDARPVPWARAQIGWLGAEGFTRLTAFLVGFRPGSDAFRFVFGGTRRSDPAGGRTVFLGAEVEVPETGDPAVEAAAGAEGEIDSPRELSRYADAVRRAVFGLYRDHRAGELDSAAVGRFNRALVLAGGPALVAWGVYPEGRGRAAPTRAADPARAGDTAWTGGSAVPAGMVERLRHMAGVLEELGHPVEVTAPDGRGAPGADALAALDATASARTTTPAPGDRFELVPPAPVGVVGSGTPGAGRREVVPTSPLGRPAAPAAPLGAGTGVRPGGRLSIASRGHLPTAKVGTPYAHALDVDGGRPPFVWSLVEGTLPAGMRLDRERGRLVGAPEEAGLFEFTLSAAGSRGGTDRKPFALGVAEATAGVLVAKTERAYDGEPKPVAVRTDPPGLEVAVTYDGADRPPTKPGSYVVSVRVTEPGYRGRARATLVIREGDVSGPGPDGGEHASDLDSRGTP